MAGGHKKKSLIILLIIFFSSNAQAWELWGLKSGMTEEEIAKIPGYGNKKQTALANLRANSTLRKIFGDGQVP